MNMALSWAWLCRRDRVCAQITRHAMSPSVGLFCIEILLFFSLSFFHIFYRSGEESTLFIAFFGLLPVLDNLRGSFASFEIENNRIFEGHRLGCFISLHNFVDFDAFKRPNLLNMIIYGSESSSNAHHTGTSLDHHSRWLCPDHELAFVLGSKSLF